MSISHALSLIVGLLVAWSLYRAHINKNGMSHFNMFDLLMENGRVSKVAAVCMGSFAVTSWVIVQLTIAGKLNDVIFAAYCAAWVAPIVTKMLSKDGPQIQVGDGK